MDAELKAKWVKALRSGEYKQARYRLQRKTTGGMCCIGVCMHLVDKKFNLVEGITGDAARRIGLTADQQGVLVSMNDGEKRTFKTIAGYIEKNL